jgi:hypothetical protein
MALSEELKKVYSSNPVDTRYYDTIEVSHSMFSQTYYFIRDSENKHFTLEDGTKVEFLPYGFDIRLPEVGSPQQDIVFAFDSVGGEVIKELERAAQKINEPIILTYRVFIDGFATPQNTPIRLVLTNIVADNRVVSATATRPDLYKRIIPSGNHSHFDKRFHGLWV